MPIIILFLILMMRVSTFAASKDFAIEELFVAGNSNNKESITVELASFLNGNSVEKVTGIPSLKSRIHAQLTVTLMESYTLTVSSSTADSATVAAVGNFLEPYVTLRVMGHSAGYASWVAWSGLNECPMELSRDFPGVESLKGYIAYPWVRSDLDKIPLISFPLLTKSHAGMIFVVDGDLAWMYWPGKSEGYAIGNRWCVDALEFSSGLKEIFFKLRHDWNVRKKGRRTDPAMWGFFQRTLRQRYHIIWRDPMVLNPAAMFD